MPVARTAQGHESYRSWCVNCAPCLPRIRLENADASVDLMFVLSIVPAVLELRYSHSTLKTQDSADRGNGGEPAGIADLCLDSRLRLPAGSCVLPTREL